MSFHRLPLYLLLLPVLALTAQGADYDDLSNDCKGQFLYLTGSGTPLTFVRLESDGEWLCTQLANGEPMRVAPGSVTILPLYTDNDDFDLITFAAGYAVPGTTTSGNEFLLQVHREILKYRGSPRGDRLRQCLNSIDALSFSIQRELGNYLKGNKTAADTIIELLDDSAPERMIDEAVNDSDFQIALACYFRLRFKVFASIGTRLPAKYTKDVQTLMRELGTEVREAYANSRAGCQARIDQFKALCFVSNSLCTRGIPVSDTELLQFFKASVESFQRTLDFSENTEFPQWGNAMLGVFQLFPNDAVLPKQVAQFDECLKKYQDKFQQTP